MALRSKSRKHFARVVRVIERERRCTVCRDRGMPIERALVYANAAGARAVTVKGPMEGVSSFADLDAFIAEQSAWR